MPCTVITASNRSPPNHAHTHKTPSRAIPGNAILAPVHSANRGDITGHAKWPNLRAIALGTPPRCVFSFMHPGTAGRPPFFFFFFRGFPTAPQFWWVTQVCTSPSRVSCPQFRFC